MFFSKFTIKGFKCFLEEQSLHFAIPKAGILGSGITYIVGGNNSGKTTLIEGISIKENRNIKTSERVSGADPEFCLYQEDALVRKCMLIRPESSGIKEDPKIHDENTFEIISSRRHWDSVANQNYTTLGDGFGTVREFNNRQNSLEVGSELRTIEKNDTRYQEFIDLVQRVIPEFTKFAVAYEDNHYIEYISNSGVRHKTDLLGDGVITVIRILLQLYVDKPSPIIIDEPELSLHPSAQRKLLEVLAEYSQKRQIIISTHSPYLIKWEYMEKGAVVNRVIKEDDIRSQIFSIVDFTKHSKLVSAANWQAPFVMDEVAKEVFFMTDGILFLEGQEDVGLLRKESELKDINMFGYGVRGAGNFKFALSLAKDLGYKKVACLIDHGVDESKIKADLEKSFPEYKILQWNKSDIRDKTFVKYPPDKVGYFNDKGIKKDESQLDDFNVKVSDVKNYLTN